MESNMDIIFEFGVFRITGTRYVFITMGEALQFFVPPTEDYSWPF